MTDTRHQCMIYEGSPSRSLPGLAAIIFHKLNEGFRCLYLNSPTMVAGMSSTLASINIDVKSVVEKGSLILSSELVLPDGVFDSKAMLKKLEDSLDQALRDGYKGLWASGDMTWEFGPARDFSKLLDYELGLEEIFHRRKELCGVCQYHKDTLPQDVIRKGLLVHPSLVVSNTLARINPHYLKSFWPVDAVTANKLDQTVATICRM